MNTTTNISNLDNFKPCLNIFIIPIIEYIAANIIINKIQMFVS